jgi:hypothetical protein
MDMLEIILGSAGYYAATDARFPFLYVLAAQVCVLKWLSYLLYLSANSVTVLIC